MKIEIKFASIMRDKRCGMFVAKIKEGEDFRTLSYYDSQVHQVFLDVDGVSGVLKSLPFGKHSITITAAPTVEFQRLINVRIPQWSDVKDYRTLSLGAFFIPVSTIAEKMHQHEIVWQFNEHIDPVFIDESERFFGIDQMLDYWVKEATEPYSQEKFEQVIQELF